ncbi:MAG: 16S rRNA (guanine(966)-N(2))-methyltransferase RsmD [Nannocystaceae bacterium]
MHRIVAGVLGGRQLMPLPQSISCVRPSSSRVRSAIFDRIQTQGRGAIVLDLFAGSGALSIEALSRGAAKATLVESSSDVVLFLGHQIERLSLRSQVELFLEDVEVHLARSASRRYDLVLLDPPYARIGIYSRVAALLLRYGWLTPDAVVVVERNASGSSAESRSYPSGFRIDASRRHGGTVVDFLSVRGVVDDGVSLGGVAEDTEG